MTPSFNKIYDIPKQDITDILKLDDNFGIEKMPKKFSKGKSGGGFRPRWFAQPINELFN